MKGREARCCCCTGCSAPPAIWASSRVPWQPGTGSSRSTCATTAIARMSQGMDYETMAADVAETMDALDLSEAAILGHSMGGKVAMRFALSSRRIASLGWSWPISPRSPTRRISAPSPGRCWRWRLGCRALRRMPRWRRTCLTRRSGRSCCTIIRPAEGWRIGLPEIAASLPRIEHWDDQAGRYSGPESFS